MLTQQPLMSASGQYHCQCLPRLGDATVKLCEYRTRRRLFEERRGQQRRRAARRLLLRRRRLAALLPVSRACRRCGRCCSRTAGVRHLRPAEQPDQVVAPRSIPGRCTQQQCGAGSHAVGAHHQAVGSTYPCTPSTCVLLKHLNVTLQRLWVGLVSRACTFALWLFWLCAAGAAPWQGILRGLQLPGDAVAALLIPKVVVVWW